LHDFETFFFKCVGFVRLRAIKKSLVGHNLRLLVCAWTTDAEELLPLRCCFLLIDAAVPHFFKQLHFLKCIYASTAWFEQNV
jgi:hypothetical protein